MNTQLFNNAFNINENKGISGIKLVAYLGETFCGKDSSIMRFANDTLREHFEDEMYWFAEDVGEKSLENGELMCVSTRNAKDHLSKIFLCDRTGIIFTYNALDKTVNYDVDTNEPRLLKLMELCGEAIEPQETEGED